MSANFLSEQYGETEFDEVLGGSNFLVSAVEILKKQKKELQSEVKMLREKLKTLESQNAAFMNVSADRLLEKLQ